MEELEKSGKVTEKGRRGVCVLCKCVCVCVCVAQACRLIQWVLSSLNGTVGLCSDYPCRPQMIA